jgi:hypothetical protein
MGSIPSHPLMSHAEMRDSRKKVPSTHESNFQLNTPLPPLKIVRGNGGRYVGDNIEVNGNLNKVNGNGTIFRGNGNEGTGDSIDVYGRGNMVFGNFAHIREGSLDNQVFGLGCVDEGTGTRIDTDDPRAKDDDVVIVGATGPSANRKRDRSSEPDELGLYELDVLPLPYQVPLDQCVEVKNAREISNSYGLHRFELCGHRTEVKIARRWAIVARRGQCLVHNVETRWLYLEGQENQLPTWRYGRGNESSDSDSDSDYDDVREISDEGTSASTAIDLRYDQPPAPSASSVVPVAWPDEPVLPDDAPEGKACVVCAERGRSVVFSPCGHMIVCVTCARTLHTNATDANTKNKCPECRRPVSMSTRVFL